MIYLLRVQKERQDAPFFPSAREYNKIYGEMCIRDRNACLWYGVFMGKMVRFLIVLSLAGMAAAQDIAPPAVPDLNRDLSLIHI